MAVAGPHAIDGPFAPHQSEGLFGTVGAVSARIQLQVSSEVFYIAVTQPTWIRFGNASVVATAGAGSMLVMPGSAIYLRWTPVGPGNYLAFIRDSSPNGVISVMPMAS